MKFITSGPEGFRVLGHPTHPPFVHFPIGLWAASVVWDMTGLLSGRLVWWEMSFWCNALGLIFASIAVLTGLIDYASLPKNRRAENMAIYHISVMLTSCLLFGASLLVRMPAVFPPNGRLAAALALSFAGLLLLLFGGWLGGELVYRHRAGLNKQDADEYNGE